MLLSVVKNDHHWIKDDVAQFQETHKDQMKKPMIPGVMLQPTLELAHKEWAVIRHLRANVKDVSTSNDTSPRLLPTQPVSLKVSPTH